VLIAVVALCCFVFAGTALAASKVFVEETGSSYVKAEHTYDLNIKIDSLAAPLFMFTDQYPPDSADCDTQAKNKLVVDFTAFGLENDNLVKSGDTITDCNGTVIDLGPEVRAVVTVDGEKYFVPVFPEIYESPVDCSTDKTVVDRVYFTIERQFIPVNGDGIITEVEIQGLQVKTPRNPGAYTVCISHTNAQCAFNIPCATLNVVETVGKVVVDNLTGCLIAGGTLNVTGSVWSTEVDASCLQKPWKHTSWPVIVEVRKATVSDVPCSDESVTNYDYAYYQSEAVQNVDCLGYPLCFNGCPGDTVIASFIAHVGADGKFDANVKLPTCVSGGPYVVTARTIEVADQNLDIPIEYKNSSWLKAPPAEAIEDYANALKLTNQHILRGEYTLYLPNGQEYTTLPHAWLKANDQEFSIVAGEPWTIKATEMLSQIDLGYEYDVTITLVDKYCNVTKNADPCGANRPPLKVELRAYVCDDPLKTKAGDFYLNDQKVIYAEILPGESSVTVQFVPTKTGKTTLEYASIFGNPGERRGAGDCCVEVNQQECMFDVKYLVTNDACDYEVAPRAGWPIKVSVHYPIQGDLRVELVDSDYNPIDWATWDTDLILEDGSILEFEAIGDFVSGDILTHPNHGEDNNKSVFYVYTDRNACDKSFIVKLVDEARGVKDQWLIGPYATPVDMVRVLQPDSWQILSTPKTLAGDGNLKSLMNDNKFYSDILVYEDNVWKIPNPVNDELTPLYAYYVKTKQNWCEDKCTNCGTEKPWYATYIFDRAADPVGMVDRYLESGWNFIGPSFDENVNNLLPTSFDNEWFEYDACCDDCCSCLIPGDGEDGCSPICEDLLFQGDRLYRMVATLCGGCDLLLNPGGPGLDSAISAAEIAFWGDPNLRANLAGFSSASVSNQTLPSWAADPLYMAFNGDGYWIYLTKPGTLAAQGQIEIIAPVSPLD
jgi:hypothetical protein